VVVTVKIVAWFASVVSLLAVAAVVLTLGSMAADGESERRLSRSDATPAAVVDQQGNLHVPQNIVPRTSSWGHGPSRPTKRLAPGNFTLSMRARARSLRIARVAASRTELC